MRYQPQLSNPVHIGCYGTQSMSSRPHNALDISHPVRCRHKLSHANWLRMASYVIRMKCHLELNHRDDLYEVIPHPTELRQSRYVMQMTCAPNLINSSRWDGRFDIFIITRGGPSVLSVVDNNMTRTSARTSWWFTEYITRIIMLYVIQMCFMIRNLSVCIYIYIINIYI